jgi:uncharacterized membrane protein YtjA (UPF0391 family)
MLHYAIVFFVLAIAAAIFGFGGIAASAAWIGKVLFIGFVVLAVVSLLAGRNTAPRPRSDPSTSRDRSSP